MRLLNHLHLLHHLSLHNLRNRIPLFRIFYSTSLLLASLLLAALLLITPSDHIYQALRADQTSASGVQLSLLHHVFVVAGCYVLTFVVSVLVYAARLFQTRSALAGVMGVGVGVGSGSGSGGGSGTGGWRYGSGAGPGTGNGSWGGGGERDSVNGNGHGNGNGNGKGNGKGGMMRFGGKKVQGRVEAWIMKGWRSSAIVAFWGRPRDLSGLELGGLEGDVDGMPDLIRRRRRKWQNRSGALVGAEGGESNVGGGEDEQEEEEGDWEPVWGEIKHPGWSWGSGSELPGVQFEAVVVELAGLLEAKAVSLAPLVGGEEQGNDVDAENGQGEEQGEAKEERETRTEKDMLPDPLVVNLLQRPVSMGMRDYLAHLTTLGMIHSPDISEEFLTRYEHARFSGDAVTEDEFETLMNLFTEILREMQPAQDAIVEGLREKAEEEAEEAPEYEEEELDGAAWGGDDGDDNNNDDGNERFMNSHHHHDTDTHSLLSNATVNHNPPPSTSSHSSLSSTLPPPSSSSPASVSESGSHFSDQGRRTVRTAPTSQPPRARRYVSAQSTSSAAAANNNNNPLRKKGGSDSTSTSTRSRSRSRSLADSEAGSVIRSAEAPKGPLDLPYAYVTDDMGPD